MVWYDCAPSGVTVQADVAFGCVPVQQFICALTSPKHTGLEYVATRGSDIAFEHVDSTMGLP